MRAGGADTQPLTDIPEVWLLPLSWLCVAVEPLQGSPRWEKSWHLCPVSSLLWVSSPCCGCSGGQAPSRVMLRGCLCPVQAGIAFPKDQSLFFHSILACC